MCKTKEAREMFVRALLEEVLGADNMYYAGQALGHRPNFFEAARHYVLHGGPENFKQRWEGQRAHA